jgi:hypothetical protein
MAVSRDTLHNLVDRLPENEFAAAQRFLEFQFQEPVTGELAASLRRGIAQANAGETVVCRDYDDLVEKLLGKA